MPRWQRASIARAREASIVVSNGTDQQIARIEPRRWSRKHAIAGPELISGGDRAFFVDRPPPS